MELPNLDYINKLARGEESVKQALLDVIRSEFPEDLKTYNSLVESNNYKNIEDIVHRIKHKFSILGLENGYNNAVELELHLRENDFNQEKKDAFEATLKSITEFLKTI